MLRRLLLALALGATPIMADAATPPLVADMRWQHRIVLAFAPTADDPRLAAQRAEWRRLGAGGPERDLVLIEVAGARVTGARDAADDLRRRFSVPADAFAALLVGKDGHVALREDAPLGPDRLTGAIDAMPMRRDEMRR